LAVSPQLPEEIEILPEYRNSFSVDHDPHTNPATAVRHLATMGGLLGAGLTVAWLMDAPSNEKLASRPMVHREEKYRY
jgi:hypothetical protein